jgi:hypothetical protein
MKLWFCACLAVAAASASTVIAQTPVSHQLTGGGDVVLRREGDLLHVVVTGPRAGLASLCLGDESQVRILHASAALAEATYEKSGAGWTLSSGFGEFALRETRTGPPPEAARRAFFDAKGWLANASNAGTTPREFTIRMSPRTRFLGVTFYATAGTETVSHWPESLDDDCRAVKVAQGYLPQSAQFRPTAWYRVP